MMEHYILQDGEPVAVDLLTWGRWFEDTEKRRIAHTTVGDCAISTVFVGINMSYAYSEGPPLLFETMTFSEDEELNEWQDRYGTLAEAQAGHDAMVDRVTAYLATKELYDEPSNE